ncbi:MAG TPA: helix-turn-helix domain-containing protein [Patescibacteria group bacterium]|nr:helix-turn-helix domain-containing protein [Patescibacteria group bacterium]
METKLTNSQVGTGLEPFLTKPGFIIDYTWMQTQCQFRASFWNDLQAERSLEETMESLALCYLSTNLNFRKIPLKGFTESIEENILRACLRLTQGNQKNAAAVLHLKPTTLFEKMRKLGINGRRIKLSGKLETKSIKENE